MSEGKHTKGPWLWNEAKKVLNSASGTIIDHAPYEGMWFARYNDEEDDANARLIAAAPDMLAALEELYNAPWLSLPGRAGDIVEAAILKAKGEA